MRRRKQHRFLQQIRIAVVLSLNVHLEQENQSSLFTIPLIPLTWLVMLWWTIQEGLSQLIQRHRPYWRAFYEQWRVRLTLLEIGFRAIFYGFGLNLAQ